MENSKLDSRHSMFLQFMTFRRIFIKDYSKIVASLIQLTKEDKFIYGDKAQGAFQILKQFFTSVSTFIHVGSLKPLCLEIDASNFHYN